MNNIFILYLIIILLFNICSLKEENTKKYIYLPFFITEENYENVIHNSETFIHNYLKKDIIVNFYLGEPPQKIIGIISNDNIFLELIDANNITNSISHKYNPRQSTSFSLIHKELYERYKKTKYLTIGFDYISFENNNEKYNLSLLFQITEDKNFNKNDIINNNYIAKIGLKKKDDITESVYPKFLTEIKKKANLNKYTISFEFIEKNKGNLIIGDELYNYNHKKYFNSQYVNTYSNENFEIFFNDIIVSQNNIKNYSFNGTYGYLHYNLGVIIGSHEYKQIIDNMFFNKLISDNICHMDIISYNSSQKYYIYNCDVDKINLNIFPKLIFSSKYYLYEFIFDYSDLFIKYNSKYYFLIIFKANNINLKIKGVWALGEPFYKKYTFTLNIDEKIIGFYNPNLPIDKDELQIDNNNDDKNNGVNINNNNNNEKQFIVKKVIYIILLIIFIIGLLVFTFYMGMKMKEERKKRANELKDDNYEYLSETKEINNTKIKQIIELNSKI